MDEVSVIRRTFTDDFFCKSKAKSIDLAAKCHGEEKEFRGFATISARAIRDLGSTVVDSRSVYLSHADIKHGFVVPRNEPLPSALNDRLDQMKDRAKFIPDPAPAKWRWFGDSLLF